MSEVPATEEAATAPPVPLLSIALAFGQLGVISFGGGLSGWMRREFVVRRRWIDDIPFFSSLAFAQLMPGANAVNLAILIGQRLRGAPGAVVALASLLALPSVILAMLTAGYAVLRGRPPVMAALEGMAAGAVGLAIATGVMGLRKGPKGWLPMLTALITVVCIAIVHLPTVAVVGVLAPASIALQLVLGRRAARGEPGDG